ncbi:MAG TPA: IclR family transcriptional regulator [Syntrophorhabdales bacterium]|nr:IclR family transcriptional regulator [Syntrophorhabdales bacterium]
MKPARKDNKEGYYNRSLERALQILDAFNPQRQALNKSELSKIIGLSRATILRLCSTLVKYHYLRQDQESKKYSLGMRLFEQGSVIFYSLSVRKAASLPMTQLHTRIGKTIFLAILDNDELLYIDKREDSNSIITFTSKIGTRRVPYWGMCGPVLMSFLPDEEIERLLKKFPLKAHTRKSITDKQKFKAWLRKVRKQDFAVDPEATLEGITGVGAPVRDFTGNVVASVGAAIFSSSLKNNDLQRIVGEVSATALRISSTLGYKP